MKIGIIGAGVVGGTLVNYFKDKKELVQLSIYDPALNQFDSMKDCEIIFISVPVPTVKDGDSYRQDLKILTDSICRCPIDSHVVIRSSILPDTFKRISFHHGNISVMPEFLTERTAQEDFEKQGVILGTKSKMLAFSISTLLSKPVTVCDPLEACLSKFAHNCAGAIKVNFFNAIYDYCQDNKLDYETVRRNVLMSGYIGAQHTKVKGPDGKAGYGGKCFPTNMAAFQGEIGVYTNVVKETIEENSHRRDDLEI